MPEKLFSLETGALISLPFALLITALTLSAGPHSDIHTQIGYAAIETQVTALASSLLLLTLRPDNPNLTDLRKLTLGSMIALGVLASLFIASDEQYPKIFSDGINANSITHLATTVTQDLGGYINIGKEKVHVRIINFLNSIN